MCLRFGSDPRQSFLGRQPLGRKSTPLTPAKRVEHERNTVQTREAIKAEIGRPATLVGKPGMTR